MILAKNSVVNSSAFLRIPSVPKCFMLFSSCFFINQILLFGTRSLRPVDRRSSAGRRLNAESKLSACSASAAVVTGGASLVPLLVSRVWSRESNI